MADAKKKEQEEEELVPVGDGVELEEDPSKKPDEDQDEDEDDDDEEEDEEEGRLGASEEDDEDDIRAKRRKERKTRKQRQKEARERDQRELQFLQQRNEQLERRFSDVEQRVVGGEVAQIDAKISDIKSKIKLADQVIAKAISANDGDSYTEAQSIRDNLRDQLNRNEYAKQQVSTQREQPQVDPRLVTNAQAWMKDHPWWDPNGRDENSRLVSRLDAQLVNEGWDPTTQEYWDELSDRVDSSLPKARGNGKAKPKPKSKGPTFSTGGRERPLKKGEVYISPERKSAMVEAGVWDDPVLRQKYLKSYAKYDSENRS